MTIQARLTILGFLSASMGVPATVTAQTYVVHRDQVVPIVMDNTLTISDNRPGDRFTAHVVDGHDLPTGARFIGRVVSVRPPFRYRPGSMELEFRAVEFPDGTRRRIDGVPVAMDKNWRRDADGRFVVTDDWRQRQADVVGGALGGFIVGSMVHRRFTGTVIGALIGVIAADSDRRNDGNTVVTRGQKLGALFNVDFRSDEPPMTADDDHPVRGDAADHQETTAVRVTDHDLHYRPSLQPYWKGEILMVPLHATARQLDFTVAIDRDSDGVTVSGSNGTARIARDTDHATVNGHDETLPERVVDRDGTIFVPIDILAEICRDPVYVNGNLVGGSGD